MLYELYIEHHAEKDLKKLADSPLFSEITAKIKDLQGNPHPQGSKKIKSTHNVFAQLHKTSNYVIPAKAGIQYYQVLPGFRFSPE
jgi:mRNA-degrading endonuclease RelE of RelBE toxin-antitoxin system